MKEIKNVGIVGMGALGLLYGSLIADHVGADAVSYLMDEERYARCGRTEAAGDGPARCPVLCNGKEYVFTVEESGQAGKKDLLIVAVKGPGLSSALDTMAACVGEDTVILSVLNGISSEEVLAERFGAEKLLVTVAQGMDAMKFGKSLSYTQAGELRIGQGPFGSAEALRTVEAFFEKAGIPYVEEADIMRRMWCKFMLNVGINQTCMVYGVPYAGALAEGEANRTMIAAMREVIAVAGAEGISLTEADLNQYVALIGTLNPEGTPSMGQDRINGRASEVELFAGTILRLAAKHGLHVPTNAFLYRRVKEIESGYVK